MAGEYRLVCADSGSVSLHICDVPNAAAKRGGTGENAVVGTLGGLVGAVQVYAGLTLVHRVGAGAFVGLTVTTALLTSLALDHFGWLRVPVHPLSAGKLIGALLMCAGVLLIAKR